VNGVNWCRILQFLVAVLNALSWYLCGSGVDRRKSG
jgi:hypothetical protein